MMLLEKKLGLHLYINVKNFSSIVRKEENSSDDLDHSLHALNTYFRCIEKKCRALDIEIEKVTGSRLHLFISGNIDDDEVLKKLYEISLFAVNASRKMCEIKKYQSIKKFEIHMGACDGSCYYYEFNNYQNNYREITSIGYPANVAAKLESLSFANHLNVTSRIAKLLRSLYSDVKSQIGESNSLKKYNVNSYYQFDLSNVQVDLSKGVYKEIIDDANNVNLKDIEFEEFTSSFKFENLSITNCKCGEAAVVMADVRGFTKMFDKDGNNLEEMTIKAERMYSMMYNLVMEKGIHVQFQGDREVAVFTKKNLKEAVISALRLQDEIKTIGLECGIGISYGYIFASRVGIKDEKDNVIIGESVLYADSLEDKYANPNETVLSKAMYLELKKDKNNEEILSFFINSDTDIYKTNIGYEEVVEKISLNHSNENYNKGNYNGAWRE